MWEFTAATRNKWMNVSFNVQPKSKEDERGQPVPPFGTDLLVEGRRVRAHVQVRFSRRLVDVLQAVSVRVHDEASVVVEKHAHAVVAQLVA